MEAQARITPTAGGLLFEGEVVRGDAVVERKVLPTGGLVQSNAPFVVAHHHEWDFVEENARDKVATGGEWLPQLVEIPMVAGGNGVAEVGDPLGPKTINATKMLAGLAAKFSVVIPANDRRLGDFMHYMSKIATDDGRYFFTYRWVQFALINNGRNAVPRPNRAMGYAFRRRVLEAGIVAPMPIDALNSRLAVLEQRVVRAFQDLQSGDIDEAAYDRIKANSDAVAGRMRAAYSRQFEPDGPIDGVQREPVFVGAEANLEDEVELTETPHAVAPLADPPAPKRKPRGEA